jgi:WD40 repeat protein
MLGLQDAKLFREREIRSNAHKYTPIGFSSHNISCLSMAKTKLDHRGCVNTSKWNAEGTKLVTGSDDRTIKVWDASNSFEDMKLLQTISKPLFSHMFLSIFIITEIIYNSYLPIYLSI